MKMIYLDYSATTPVNDSVVDTYVKVCKEYIGNPNSLHKLGIEAKRYMESGGLVPDELIMKKY